MATFKLFNNHIKISFALLAVAETLLYFSSIYIAIVLRFTTLDLNSQELYNSIGNVPVKALIFTVLHMLSMTAMGLYQVEQFRGRAGFLQMVSRIAVSMFLVAIALMALFYLLPSTQIGRGVTALAFLIAAMLIIIARRLFFATVDPNVFTSRILVLGVGNNAASLLHAGDNNSSVSFSLKGFISTPEQSRVIPEHLVIELDDSLLRIAQSLNVNEIIVALDDRRKGYPVQHLLDCKMAGLSITEPVTFLEREQGKVNLSLLNPSWMIFSDGFTVSIIKTALSRFFDICASLTILILTAPILLITALLIALEDGFRESIFYRQERVGKNGQGFQLLKFRSMQVNAEKNGAQWAAKNDVRVTRIGKFIRKVRIDELPQILNILKGDMRLVGPRPERPEFVQKLSKSISMYSQRHAVKPGLAGWAQLKYPYGATEEDAYEKLQYDLYYIKNANPVMDFFILLQTLEIVLFGKGAR
jgi:sugar transferase (PEP-CTERM system associated)